jgi:hypothetical protein
MWRACDVLRDLRITPLALRFRAVSELTLPEFKGRFFRSGFGKFFREQSCSTGRPTCPGCPELKNCSYSRLFETPVLESTARLLQKYPNAPHPFILSPPLLEDRFLPTGSEFALRLTLLHNAVSLLPEVLRAFRTLGESGDFGGSYSLQRADSCVDARTVWSADDPAFCVKPLAWEAPEERPEATRMQLRALTPLRVRVGGRYSERPGFVPVAQALLRRIQFLRAFHGQEESDWMAPLYADADRVLVESSDLQMKKGHGWSGRQRQEIPMDGVVGTMTVSGDLSRLAPYFEAGQWLHIGSQTSAGLGMIEVSYPQVARGAR